MDGLLNNNNNEGEHTKKDTSVSQYKYHIVYTKTTAKRRTKKYNNGTYLCTFEENEITWLHEDFVRTSMEIFD